MPRPRGRPRYDDLLTPAEWRVVEAIRHGMTNPVIARRQDVSVDAVKYHVANALQKLGLSNRPSSGPGMVSAAAAPCPERLLP